MQVTLTFDPSDPSQVKMAYDAIARAWIDNGAISETEPARGSAGPTPEAAAKKAEQEAESEKKRKAAAAKKKADAEAKAKAEAEAKAKAEAEAKAEAGTEASADNFDDDFGDDEGDVPSIEDVRAALKAYAGVEGRPAAMKILKDFGKASSMAELEEGCYRDVIKACAV